MIIASTDAEIGKRKLFFLQRIGMYFSCNKSSVFLKLLSGGYEQGSATAI